jgi:hypothetical protein
MKSYLIGLVLASTGLYAPAHPGGLNSEGCHNNRKTGDYHCHGGKSASPTSVAPAPIDPTGQAKSPAPSSGVTCYTGPRGGTYTITKSGRKNYNGC